MRFFDIGNRAKEGFWAVARDEAKALQIALDDGHIKTLKEARIHELPSQDFVGKPGISELEAEGYEGRIGWQGRAYSLMEVLQGKPKEPGEKAKCRWVKA